MISLAMVGVLIGSGVASTVMGVSDGITWLSNGARGEVLQYIPGSKRVERGYQVGAGSDPIEVTQGDGIVALRNERTGEIMTVDMSRMRVGGVRASRGGSKVVVTRGMMFVLDTERNRLSRVDPVRAEDLGEPWGTPDNVPIADVAADDEGTVWVVDARGVLRGLSWEPEGARFVERKAKRVALVGEDAVLTGHEVGVSVFGPRAGVIAQVGTKNDGYRQSSQLIGVDPARVNGPSDLVSAAVSDKTMVVILDRGEVRVVSTGNLGCPRPAKPVAFDDTIFVVCQGSGKVIQLTRDGKMAGPPIATPGEADAELITDEGRLLFNVGGAPEGIQIERGGAAERFNRIPLGGTQSMQLADEDQPVDGLLAGRDQAREDLEQAPATESGSPDEAPRTSVGDEIPREEVVPEGQEQEELPTSPVIPPTDPVVAVTLPPAQTDPIRRDPAPQPVPPPAPEPAPVPEPAPAPSTAPERAAAPSFAPEPVPAPAEPDPVPVPAPDPDPDPVPAPVPAPLPTREPEPTAPPTREPEPEPTAPPTQEPEPTAPPTREPEPEPTAPPTQE
ncbi:MAG TPA: hypothetical protein GXZ30_04920, partial [Propionibacterium sp.]|nr:hypothetical protein [Propionibacterium sp.]